MQYSNHNVSHTLFNLPVHWRQQIKTHHSLNFLVYCQIKILCFLVVPTLCSVFQFSFSFFHPDSAIQSCTSFLHLKPLLRILLLNWKYPFIIKLFPLPYPQLLTDSLHLLLIHHHLKGLLLRHQIIEFVTASRFLYILYYITKKKNF
jgi:hypothetical protein